MHGLHTRNWTTFREMGWAERLGFALVTAAGFAPFYFLVTRAWPAAVAMAAYLALLIVIAPVAMSLYRHYDVRCLLRALQLGRALKRGEIVLYYQPKVSIETGELRAVEALARWEHPRRGLLSPAHFLAAVERTWIAKRFNLYVLRAAIAQGRAWEREGMAVVVCVNITPRVLASRDFAREVGALLAAADYRPSLLDLEVTETVFADSHRLIRPLQRLADLGVGLILDDFGTGHSSLRRLVDLPVHTVKVDRSFVMRISDEANAAVVNATTGLAHSLSRNVCAEGVETEEGWHRVRALGCDIVQGYLIATPLPARELTQWTHNWGQQRRELIELRQAP